MKKSPHFIWLVLLAASTVAVAADPPARDPRDCSRIAAYDEMVSCFSEKGRDTEMDLALTYQALLEKLRPGPTADQLRRSQDAWLIYRSSFCGLQISASNGSFSRTVGNMCFSERGQLRLKELAHQLTCGEGDMSCFTPH